MNKLLYIIIFLLGNLSLSAQEVEVNATADTNIILIGEQIKIALTISYRTDGSEINIQFPQLNDTLSEFIEILSKSDIDTLRPNKDDGYLFQQTQQITITSFDSGYYEIPPFHFTVNNDSISTSPFSIEVQNMAVDTSNTIYDIKQPLAAPFSFMEWLKEKWMWIVGILTVLILLIVLFVYLKNKKPAEVVKTITPTRSADEVAIERLKLLQQEELWQAGKIKQYHSAISEIIRQYIELRYQVNALEETTTEIMHDLRLQEMEPLTRGNLKQILVLSDLVKFAKEQPLAKENEMSMTNALAFINSTKLSQQPTSNAE